MARKYSKLNFIDAVKIITPDVYLEDDRSVSGLQVKLTDQVINSHLISINNIANTLNVSALGGFPSYSAINNPSGFGQYLVKQNQLTEITASDFEKNILRPLNVKFSDYSTSGDFLDFLSGTLLPKISLNSNNLLVDTSAKYSSTPSGTHAYLIDNLSWLYFLNTNATVMDPSTIVASSMMEKFYFGKPYRINDGIKDYQQYIWENYSNFSSIDAGFLPTKFLSGVGTYTSGNQNLEKLKTLIDVIYSPLYIDSDDTTVKSALESFLESNTQLATTEVAGPFHKFLRALSYSLRDLDNEIESLETLTSVQDCPVEYLPYLASLLGWTLYGNNETSWRNQVKDAVTLYKKKGTKEGLVQAMNTVIVQNPIQTSSVVKELHESYLPNLIYYLLLTESDKFDGEDFTIQDALDLGIESGASISNKDQTIRAAVDSIILRAVRAYPHLFYVRNEPFRVSLLEDGTAWFGPTTMAGGEYFTGLIYDDSSRRIVVLGDPAFNFEFRGRSFPIPPWEEEKFYRNCLITEDLLRFYVNELKRFCVDSSILTQFYDYVYGYTLSGTDRTDLYLGNGYVMFTSGLENPPNYKSILDNFDYDDYTALSLWNGKSSTFDFTVCAGNFDSILFQDSSGLYTKSEILDSLQVVDDFSPAKAVPRTRVVLSQTEFTSGLDFICPSIRYNMPDVAASSAAIAGYEVSGIWIRGTGFGFGGDTYPGFDDSRSTVGHQSLPTFTREQASYSRDVSRSVLTTSSTVPASSGIPRVALRRRNFHNTLTQKGWHRRDGFSMPTLYNNTSGIVNTWLTHDYLPLGFIPSSFSFAEGTPENLSGVYSKDCAGSASNHSYFGLDVSNAFYSRDYDQLAFSSCDQFVRRDILPEEVYTLFKFGEYKKNAIAQDIVDYNFELLSSSATAVNLVRSYANSIDDDSFEKYLSPDIDKRLFSPGLSKGIHQVYQNYNKYFLSGLTTSSLPEKLLLTYDSGGPNILSHTYGPIYFNSNFSVDGSAIRDDLYLQNKRFASEVINRSLSDPIELNLNAFSSSSLMDLGSNTVGGLLVSSIESSASPYYGGPEYITENFLSGVAFIDTSADTNAGVSSNNKFIIYDLSEDNRVWDPRYNNHLINNRVIYLQNTGQGFPRVQFDLSGYSHRERNILIPEHDFEVTVKFLSGRLNSVSTGGGRIGIILRTKREYMSDGTPVVFFWSPEGKWQKVNAADISDKRRGREKVLEYAHIYSGGEIKDLVQDNECNESFDNNTLLKYFSDSDVQSATFNFHTKNNLTEVPFEYGTYYQEENSSVYNGQAVQLHRAYMDNTNTNQNYVLEVFQIPQNNPEEEFVIIDNISVVDQTLNEAASIPYEARIPSLLNQKDVVTSPKLLMDDGQAIPQPFRETEVAGTGEDVFRTMQGDLTVLGSKHPMRYDSELWTVHGQPNLDSYTSPPGFYGPTDESYGIGMSDSARIRSEFFRGYPAKINIDPVQGFQFDFANTLFHTDGAPWGKLPFVGIANSTWSGYKHGPDLALFDRGGLLAGFGNDVTKKTNFWRRYWQERNGFLSFNQWSDYINVGERQQLPYYSINGVGPPGADLYYWKDSNEHFYQDQGAPLLALSRPGHSYDEQHKFSTYSQAAFLALFSDKHTNPLGYTAYEDRFFYSEMENTIGGPPPSTEIISVGAPCQVDFTTRRVKANVIESGDTGHELGQYSNPANWEYVPEGEDPLVATMMDPLGQVPSSLAIYQLINTKLNTPDAGGIAEQNLQTFDYTAGNTTNTLDKFIEDGAITFPPMSVYRDISREHLVHGRQYSFSVYVRGDATTGTGDENQWATSAILTISPIGSQTSYTRITCTIPKFGSSDVMRLTRQKAGHTLTGSTASLVETISVPVNPNQEGSAEVNWYRMRVTIPYNAFETDRGGKPNLGLRCTLQAYNNSFENQLPESLPEGVDDYNGASRAAWQHIPCKLLTWGYALHEGGSPGTFRRITANVTKLGPFSFGAHGLDTENPEFVTNVIDYSLAPGTVPGVITYDSDVEDVSEVTEYRYTAKKVFYDDDKQLHVYDSDSSALKKLTLVQDVADNDLYNSKLYKTVNLSDNSGVSYSGPIEYSLSRNLLRPERYANEAEELRALSVSGASEGTNIGLVVKGSVPIPPEDMLPLFRHFNRLGKTTGLGRVGVGLPPMTQGGFNTRDGNYASGVHNVSGGSRLSYRVSPDFGSSDNKRNTIIVKDFENYQFIDTSAT